MNMVKLLGSGAHIDFDAITNAEVLVRPSLTALRLTLDEGRTTLDLTNLQDVMTVAAASIARGLEKERAG